MKENTHNGWRNRETWLVNVWFDPETASDLEAAKETLENAVDECPDFLRDFIDLSCIDWQELEDGLEGEEEEES